MKIGWSLAAIAEILAMAFLTVACATQRSENFYRPPAQLPARNGALIRQEPMQLAWAKAGGGRFALDGSATRIMYRSTDQAGRAVAVTGTYIEPHKPWSGRGPRPLVSFAVGTQGVGDACAPSKTLSKGVNLSGGHLMAGYEIPFIAGFLARGVAVVMTDYIGLGNPERLHTYINRADQGHAVLDAARAALALSGASVTPSSPIGLYGYSQGGAGSAAAAELAASYAPELKVRGAYVGAPPADLGRILDTIDGTGLTGVIAWQLNGTFEYHPELQGQLDEITNDAGKRWLKSARNQCLPDTYILSGFRSTNRYTRSGEGLGAAFKKYPALLAAIEEQRLGKVRPPFPVMVVSGTNDDLVDHKQAKQLAANWCALGGNVTYRVLPQIIPSFGFGMNHTVPTFVESLGAQGWLVERLEGQSARSNCARLDRLP